ncbi:MAG TPA: TSUP family transporter [Candidatus Poseidonia sp.]|nr:TSUP family transporter [Poseidonia sp.]
MEIDLLVVLGLAGCLLAAALTVPAGFGLATMTTPIFLLWFEPHHAIAGVAIVHGAHNAAKSRMLRTHIDRNALRRFGWALLLGALIGALLQTVIPPDPLLLLVGIALIVLPLLKISESWTNLRLPEAEDRIGGFGSGFLGGLTGHQGALRAMFLRQRLPDKAEYAATAAILALVVDFTRIPVYLWNDTTVLTVNPLLLVGFVVTALVGAQIGRVWLEKWKSNDIQKGIMVGLVVSGVLYVREALEALSAA